MASKDGQGTVDLLGKYHTGKVMWQGKTTKGKKKVGALTGHRGPSIGRTNGEYDSLSSLISDVPDVHGELLGGVLLAATVEQDRIGSTARLPIQPVEKGCL
jgi:hypothetical protein